jgi:predicted glycoside hydrolase/deacetylase ChbG (UPF0249 family)
VARLLIVNADDFGYSPGVNAGIARAHRDGIVTATSVMANLPAAAEAEAYRGQHPRLGFGVHLTLTTGRPLTPPERVPSLVDEAGQFLPRARLLQGAKSEHIALECAAQFAAVEAMGLKPTHLDSHHHVHACEPVLSVVTEFARDRGLPVRATSPELRDRLRAAGVPAADTFLDEFYPFDASKTGWLVARLETLPEGLTEVACHPGHANEALRAMSSYVAQREGEVEALVSPPLRRAVREAGIRLVTHAEALGGT